MTKSVLAAFLALHVANAADAAFIIPPGGYCCQTCSCVASKQLLTVPAFFDLNTRSDPTQQNDWNRIQNVGRWVNIIVADSGFENRATSNYDLGMAPTTQPTYGYVYTGSGRVALGDYNTAGTVLYHINNWRAHYSGTPYLAGIFLDVGPAFDPSQIKDPNTGTPVVTGAYETQTISNAFGQQGYSFPGYQSYYGTLYQTIHGFSYGVMLNAAQWPNEWIVASGYPQAADYALTWEDTLYNYL